MVVCQVSKQLGNHKNESILSVLAPPEVKLSDLSMTVYENRSFQLTCEALVPDTGHPDVGTGVNITWYKNDNFIQKDSKILFLYQHNFDVSLGFSGHS